VSLAYEFEAAAYRWQAEAREAQEALARVRADLAAAKFGADTLMGERNRADAACVILAEAHRTARAEADSAMADAAGLMLERDAARAEADAAKALLRACWEVILQEAPGYSVLLNNIKAMLEKA
jgi:hypothetical protein